MRANLSFDNLAAVLATIGGAALSRFFSLHVFVIPGALLALVGVHLWLVVKRGVSVPPVPGQIVDPKTYDAQYEQEVHKNGVPFWGDAILKDCGSGATCG